MNGEEISEKKKKREKREIERKKEERKIGEELRKRRETISCLALGYLSSIRHVSIDLQSTYQRHVFPMTVQ